MSQLYNDLAELQEARKNGEITTEEEYERRKLEIIEYYSDKLTTVSDLYSFAIAEDAKIAEEATRSLFGTGTNLDNVPTYTMPIASLNSTPIVDILTESKLCPSKSDARRMIEGGGITLNDNKVADIRQTITTDDIKEGYALLRKGKKNYVKVVFED
jgi:tyrosyl-tRNA synthetase